MPLFVWEAGVNTGESNRLATTLRAAWALGPPITCAPPHQDRTKACANIHAFTENC